MKQGRHIAIFLPDMSGGGAQRVMLNLANGIAARGHAVDLVLAQAKGPYLSSVADEVRVIDLQAKRVLASLPAFVRYLRRVRPYALLSGLGSANNVALWARRLAAVSTRLVISEHNTLSAKVRQPQNWRAKQMPKLAKQFYPWADAIIAVSHGVANDLAQMAAIPHQNIHVIYNPVITPELRKKAQAPLEHPWFQPGQPPVVLGVGRLAPQKGFSLLIEAFAQMRQSCSARLVILGEGEERTMLEQLTHSLRLAEDVCLPGFVENPYAYMAHATLFVLSSKWEGLPTVLIEALYCGATPIATDCPSGPREILADGRYGRLVPVGDVAALASMMKSVLSGDVLRPLPESWRPFEQETVIDQYVDVLLGEQSCVH